MANLKNKEAVAAIAQKLDDTKNFVLINFDKASHNTIEELRQSLFPKATRISVVKNSLMKLVLERKGILKEDQAELLKGPSALMTLPEDWSEVMGDFFKFNKLHEEFGFKFGIIDDKFYQKDELLRLAQLPSKSELVTKIIMSLRSPQYRVATALKYNMQRLVYILGQKGKQN